MILFHQVSLAVIFVKNNLEYEVPSHLESFALLDIFPRPHGNTINRRYSFVGRCYLRSTHW